MITLNSGSELLDEREGVITHVGQTESSAGVAAGAALAEAGASKVLCIIHEENNTGLQERCAGAAEGLGGELIKVQVSGAADPASTAREIGAAIDAQSPDAVLTLDPDIASAARKEVTSREKILATFDLSPDVLDAISAGDILFAVDQQPYLQGYLPVVFLELAVRNRNEVGAGRAGGHRSGPGHQGQRRGDCGPGRGGHPVSTSTTAPTAGGASAATDERLRREPLWRKLLIRPSVGAAIAAIVVFIFFSLADSTGTFHSPSGVASWMGVSASYGIMAVRGRPAHDRR